MIFINHLKNLIFGDYESFSNEKDYKVFFITNLFLFIGTLIHILYAGVFIYLNIKLMVFCESLSIIALITAIFINRKKSNHVPALIMCMEIGLNGMAWAMVLSASFSHYLYTFVALLAVFLFLDFGRKQKVLITVFLLICVNVSHSLKNIQGINISDKNIEWLSYLSINMVFLLLTVELTINEITNEAIKEMHKRTVKKMVNEIMHDPLTQLYNRRYFKENKDKFNLKLGKQVCCVAMMDLDFFKKINDTYGHDAGDHVLMFFADTMRNAFDASDVMMRWGGEEFLVLFRDEKMETVIKKLNQLREEVKKSEIRLAEEVIKITFTAGVCKVESEMTVSEAITQSDKLLYHGKAFGRDCICYK